MPQTETKPTVIVTRTQPGADHFCTQLHTVGYHAVAMPALDVVPILNPASIDQTKASALIITSGHTLRVLETYANVSTLKKMPLYTVGTATADLAKDLHWNDVHVGPGDVQSLARYIQSTGQNGPFYHFAGKDMAKNSHESLSTLGDITHINIYRTKEKNIDFQLLNANVQASEQVFITLHSAKAARNWNETVQTYEDKIAWSKIIFLCLSPAVLESLRIDINVQAYVATEPTEDALITCLHNLT